MLRAHDEQRHLRLVVAGSDAHLLVIIERPIETKPLADHQLVPIPDRLDPTQVDAMYPAAPGQRPVHRPQPPHQVRAVQAGAVDVLLAGAQIERWTDAGDLLHRRRQLRNRRVQDHVSAEGIAQHVDLRVMFLDVWRLEHAHQVRCEGSVVDVLPFPVRPPQRKAQRRVATLGGNARGAQAVEAVRPTGQAMHDDHQLAAVHDPGEPAREHHGPDIRVLDRRAPRRRRRRFVGNDPPAYGGRDRQKVAPEGS